jgi:hypothetical protein
LLYANILLLKIKEFEDDNGKFSFYEINEKLKELVFKNILKFEPTNW